MKDSTLKLQTRFFTFVLIVFISLFICCALCNAAAEDPLGFDLRFQKATYKAGEPIKVTMALSNRGVTPLLVNRRFFVYDENIHEIFLQVKDCNGKDMPLNIKIKMRPLEPKDFGMLKPGRSFTGKVDLNQYYALPPGTYTVMGTYENIQDVPGKTAWKGRITSKTYRIYIE